MKKWAFVILSLIFSCMEAGEYKKKKISPRSRNQIIFVSAFSAGIMATGTAFLGFFIKQIGENMDNTAHCAGVNTPLQVRFVNDSTRFSSMANVINKYGIAVAGLGMASLVAKSAYNNCFEAKYNSAVDCINQVKRYPELQHDSNMRKKMIATYNNLYVFSKTISEKKQYRLEALVILQELKNILLLLNIA